MVSARKMFVWYNGNKGYMARNGDLDAYQAFAVPHDLERQWAAAREQELLEECRKDTGFGSRGHRATELITWLAHYPNGPVLTGFLDRIVERQGQIDSLSRLIMAEQLLDNLVQGWRWGKPWEPRILPVARALIEGVLVGPVAASLEPAQLVGPCSRTRLVPLDLHARAERALRHSEALAVRRRPRINPMGVRILWVVVVPLVTVALLVIGILRLHPQL